MDSKLVIRGSWVYRIEDDFEDEWIGCVESVERSDGKTGEFSTDKWFRTYGDNRDFTLIELQEITKFVEQYKEE